MISNFTFNERILKDDIKKYMTIRSQQACMRARDVLKEKAASAIESFYNQYSPIYYRRTDAIRKDSIQPFYQQYGHLIVGGIFINGSQLKKAWDIVPSLNTELRQYSVISVWHYGEHGSVLINAGIRMNPAPFTIVQRFWKQEKNKCMSYGASIAKRAGYRLISFPSAF